MAEYHLERIYSASRVATRIREMAGDIVPDYEGIDFTLAMILLGSAAFASSLCREISRYREPRQTILWEAMGVSSYEKTVSNGRPTVTQPFKNPEKNIRDQHVLIAEDIIHTGHTLADTVLPYVWAFEPKSVAVATLLVKDGSAEVNVPGIIYEGLHIKKEDYVVGTGLDMEGKHRGLAGIWKVVFDQR